MFHAAQEASLRKQVNALIDRLATVADLALADTGTYSFTEGSLTASVRLEARTVRISCYPAMSRLTSTIVELALGKRGFGTCRMAGSSDAERIVVADF